MSSSFGTFGATFGNLGTGGGVLLPASPEDILQDLQFGVESDGITLKDNKAGANVDEPELRNVNCLSFDGTQYLQTNDLPSGSSSVEFSFEVDSSITGVQFGSTDGGSTRFYMTADFTGWSIGYGDSFSKGSIGVSSGTKCDCLLTGGRLYVNGSEVHDVSGTFAGVSTEPLWIGAYNNNGSIFDPDKNNTYGYKFRQTTPIDIIIYAGDSNCSGRPDSWGTLPTAEQAEQVAFYSYDVDSLGISDEQNLKPIQEVDGWGCEVVAGASIRNINGRYTAFLKVSQGGSKCAVSWQKGGAEYGRLEARYNQLITDLTARGFVPTVRSFWWNNGANDAADEARSLAYQANFNQLWSDLTTDTTIPSNTPIIMAAIQKDTSTVASPYTANVVSQHALLGAQDGITLINTDSIALGPDGVHWNEVGIQLLGDQFALEYLVDNSAEEPWDTTLPMAEGDGAPYTSDGVQLVMGDGSTSSTFPVWSTLDGILSNNHKDGFSPLVETDGISTYLQEPSSVIESVANINTMIYLDSEYSTASSPLVVFTMTTSASYPLALGNYNSAPASLSFGTSIQNSYITDSISAGWHTIDLDWDGSKYLISIDGVEKVTLTEGTPFQFANHTAVIGRQGAAGSFFPNRIRSLTIGATQLIDGNVISGLTNNGATLPRIHSDVIDATNPAGYTHNESECDVQQVDADEAVFGGASFYGDGVTWDEKTYAQIDAHYTSSNGSLGLWVKKIGENVCRMSQYSLTKDWTPGEVERNESYFGGGGAALRDVNGDLITDVNGYVIFAA